MTVRTSIITTCKGRLDHLRETLPHMLAVPDAEVIVVDYSCPDGAAAWVREHHPAVTVVEVEGQSGFSNWKARNAGAAVAKGQRLVFCDADIVLSDRAGTLLDSLPDRSVGFFKNADSRRSATAAAALDWNQLKGFQTMPAKAFHQIGGYDVLVEGYAAGADTDLEDRLRLLGLKPVALDRGIVERAIAHDRDARLRFHQDPIGLTYLTGYIYRKAKLALMQFYRRDLKPDFKRTLYRASRHQAEKLGKGRDSITMRVDVLDEPLLMPRQLGYRRARFKMSLKIDITGSDPLEPPVG